MFIEINRGSSPGIGKLGEIPITNNGTRAVLVTDQIITSPYDFNGLTGQLLNPNMSPLITRRIIKGISSIPFSPNIPITDTQFIVEACLPFEYQNQSYYWIVAGLNTPPRIPDQDTLKTQRRKVTEISQNPRYDIQTGANLIKYFQQNNPEIKSLGLFRITRNNFNLFEAGLTKLYDQAFAVYPYNPINTIYQTCDENVFVAAVINNGYPATVASVTGAEIMDHPSGIQIAEIGDSASLSGITGLGALMKRFLIQTLVERGQLPELLFTDSRIGQVLKANRMAGLILTDTILPLHTEIASELDPVDTQSIIGENGQPVILENMTMTYAGADHIIEILREYGGIPNNQSNLIICI